MSYGSGVASMGPRPFSHGNLAGALSGLSTARRFNGAATFQSRKLAELGIEFFPTPELQWGRDLSVTETSWTGCWAAKTTPLQWGRDLSVTETRKLTKLAYGKLSFNGAATFQSRKRPSDRAAEEGRGRFNGAATFQSRKPGRLIQSLIPISPASMGPRPFSRGNPVWLD